MKRIFRAVMVWMVASSSLASAGNLVLSQDLEMSYPDPLLISHTSTMLLIKFDGWVLSHEVVNPSSIYSNIDLSGVEEDYLKSVFQPEIRESLPKWLRVLSEEQALSFGLPESGVTNRVVGEFEIFGSYNEHIDSGYIYVFDRAAIHSLTVLGSEDRFNEVITSIKER